ncbi:MAG: choice-of-anchor X domain-containing protein [Planctomycetota bacterium]
MKVTKTMNTPSYLYATSLLAAGMAVWLASRGSLAQEPDSQKAYTATQAATRLGPYSPHDLRREPPTARQVSIKWLERDDKDGNALLSVEFETADAKRLQRSESLSLDGFQAPLRDDGKGGDEKAGDGVFSAIVRLDFDQLIKDAQADGIQSPSNKPLPVFKGRVKVGEEKIERITPSTLKKGATIKIPRTGFPPFAPPLPTLDIAKSLMITDLSVVNDPTRTGDPCTGTGAPMGKWSFGHLMTEMANQPQTGIDPSLFVRRWLARWETAQQVNDQQVAARLQIRNKIIIPWENASGGPGAPLDLAKAPFRLLAIVNRIDLRDNFIYGGGGGAGEARFVFCAVDVTQGCQEMPFTVIFEYGIKKANCVALKAWGQEWAHLSTLNFGDPAFNTALEAITEQFVKAGADPSKLPNKSALNQLRTNEVALDFPWQIREFTIDSTSVVGHLGEATVKQTPGPVLNHQTVIADYVNANIPAILADKHAVPAMFPGITPFLGGEALTNPNRAFWDGPKPPSPAPPAIVNRDARFHFSLNTCNGCHGGETFPSNAPFFFTHIQQRAANQEARLSSFLAGHLSGTPGPDVQVTDPADGAPSRPFNDLARRQVELQKVLSINCRFPFGELFFKPLRMVH